MNFKVKLLDKTEKNVEINLEKVLVVGYSGSNVKKIEEHILELKEQLGVPAPKRIPTIFECSLENLTFNKKIKFVGDMTSGEVEFLIIKHDDNIYIGIGSDHTDRKLESVSVLKSKQVCPKPASNILWDYEEIKDIWAQLQVVSYQKVEGKEIMYQSGNLSQILPVEKIIAELEERIGNINNSVIFSGTVPLVGKFEYGDKFIGKIVDNINDRELILEYEIEKISEEER